MTSDIDDNDFNDNDWWKMIFKIQNDLREIKPNISSLCFEMTGIFTSPYKIKMNRPRLRHKKWNYHPSIRLVAEKWKI